MSFKNALKNLVANFGTVWALLLYMVIFAAVITGVSLPFLLPVLREFDRAGVFRELGGAFSSIFGEGGWQGFTTGLDSVYNSVVNVFDSNDTVATLTVSFVIFVVIIGFRFFLGLHEIPLATVIDGRMSSNARYGLGGKFFSTLGVSVRYSFAKMLYTVIFDAALFAILYGLKVAIVSNVAFLFAGIFVAVLFLSFRFSVSACWAPMVACGEAGVVKGFVRSARLCFKNFGTFFSTYFVSFILLFALGLFVTVFTLGAGLVIVLPVSVTYFAYLNATEFFGKTGKRYYVDGAVVITPVNLSEDNIATED